MLLLKVIAVLASQVAVGSNRFDEDLEITGSFDHSQFPKSGTCADFLESVTCPMDFCQEYRGMNTVGQGHLKSGDLAALKYEVLKAEL